MDIRAKIVADHVEELNDSYYIMTIDGESTLMYKDKSLGIVYDRVKTGSGDFDIISTGERYGGEGAVVVGEIVKIVKEVRWCSTSRLFHYTDYDNKRHVINIDGIDNKVTSLEQEVAFLCKELKIHVDNKLESIKLNLELKEWDELNKLGNTENKRNINVSVALVGMNQQCIRTKYIHNMYNSKGIDINCIQFYIQYEGQGRKVLRSLVYDLNSGLWANGHWEELYGLT